MVSVHINSINKAIRETFGDRVRVERDDDQSRIDGQSVYWLLGSLNKPDDRCNLGWLSLNGVAVTVDEMRADVASGLTIDTVLKSRMVSSFTGEP
jgi:hypothetical protein